MADLETLKTEFAQRLTQALEDKNWTQAELARKTRLSRDAISTYTTGRSLPQEKNVAKIAKALGIPVAELLPNRPLSNRRQTSRRLQSRQLEDGRFEVSFGMTVLDGPAYSALLQMIEREYTSAIMSLVKMLDPKDQRKALAMMKVELEK